MSQQSAFKRPRTKLWQFSIAHLLAAIFLVAVTCGAFRLNVSLGICVLHLAFAAAITFVRTRIAIWHGEELWESLEVPLFARQNEKIYLCTTSIGVALATLFFFHVGLWSAGILAVVVSLFVQILLSPIAGLILGIILAIGSPVAGIMLSVWWLRSTWPKSYFLPFGENHRS